MSSETPIILIVDDEQLNRKLIEAHLVSRGYTVWEAESGSEALQKAAQIPDLILLDVMMPEASGFEVCRSLKESEATRRIPVIYLSALKDSESKVRGLELGGVDFVSKPFNGPELLARIKAHLTIRRQEEELGRYAKTLEQMVEDRTQQLIHADRLATVGTFAAAIVHEINNPLTIISAGTELIKMFRDDVETFLLKHLQEEQTAGLVKEMAEFDTYLAQIEEGHKRIFQVADTLRAYSRANGEGSELCLLADPVNDAVRLLQYRVKHGVSIENSIPSDLMIFCNRRKLSQVFVNLFSNAIDAMVDQRGSIEVEAVAAGASVEIRVKDSGAGIPDKDAEKIFDPFFTTKAEDKGTGLGLFIVKSIIDEHGGKIGLAKFCGLGAEFAIELPLSL
ncbi:MAG: response regulator [Syntrophobacteraceae bacterium]|nr:response regulator [Syntrophobacteraceae bacterium]